MTANKPSLPKDNSWESSLVKDQALLTSETNAISMSQELVTKSLHGQRIGRPKTRLEALKAVPTRCPTQIYTYLKGITPFLYPSLTVMFESMMRRFLDERPWEHGLHWRKPKTSMSFAGGATGKTGWEQVNIQLPQELALALALTADSCSISNAAFCYTAIFWWVQYIYPPAKMTARQTS
ncbi:MULTISPECIES: hypothetical protein [unclassified Undibacterium]|uniref:hypothetical protein n=1 Tax=unclassified Undibacterium TaxID=2630295 RepID=UPI002AC9177C|nr:MULTISPECIES: hypothetical protein [unclassified Undibacterium]MEB0137679.1 hypothetical protein [Undibacterium sp. CCC2.1]MEB0172669.1 hypothetical protein [Undibacterium sp. CCC1.1]MEB0177371.1 hypothetical protein [Undibacterium sp. CCC3.4]MEB0215464.1 hypothetical protein [Undibacterium sp. 5I2]WPX42253.1 hypothetical protein RHM61_12710 [Undibacterium sp. CCC3.4]